MDMENTLIKMVNILQGNDGMKVKGIIYSKDNKVLYEGDFI